MFPVKTISEALGVDLAVDAVMSGKINLWMRMFAGDEKEPSLGLPAAIAAELARLTTIENEIQISGSARADYLNSQFERVRDRLRSECEYGIAGGGLIFKPYICGEGIAVAYSHAGGFYPVSFDAAGRLTAVVFTERLQKGDKLFHRLEYHHMEDGGCIIENRAYKTDAQSEGARLGEPVELAQIPEWADLEPITQIANVDRLLMGYFRVPLANHISEDSPLGVSAYSRAVDLIKEADRQYGRILWEYEGSELAVFADPTLLVQGVRKEFILGEREKRLFRALPGLDSDKKIDVFSPTIRDSALCNGLNNQLKRIEYTCGLAYGTLSDPQNVDKTAEEIRASKQRSYALVSDTQKALQAALEDLAYAMDIWATLGSLAPSGSYTVSCDWDDSIINDPEQRRQRAWQYVAAGKFPMWRYLVDYAGYAESEARELVGEAAGSLTNPFGFEGGGA